MAELEIAIEKTKKPEGDYVEFSPPPGLMIPEGLTADATFELPAEFRVKPDGKICLVAIDGVDLPEKEDDEIEEEEEVEVGPDPLMAGIEAVQRNMRG